MYHKMKTAYPRMTTFIDRHMKKVTMQNIFQKCPERYTQQEVNK